MGRNIQYQLLNAIDQAFDGGGRDKHSDKLQGERMSAVYSFAERGNLMQLSAQIGKFIKEYHPDVKMVVNIKPEMVQEFLNSKTDTCNAQSLGQYASRIHKLQQIVNKAYSGRVNWYGDLIVPASEFSNEKKRDIAMSRKDYESILGRSKNMKSVSKAPIAIECAGRFGMRVSETCKLQPRDIDFDRLRIHIHESKGGRSRDISISQADAAFLKRYSEGRSLDRPIVSIKEDSVNKYLVRAEEDLGIRGKYQAATTGIHSIRKMRAQELYDEYRSKGLGAKEALNLVSEYLGHGKNRKDVMKAYILKI